MELCDDEHEEVCYECRRCPVCEKIGEIADLEDYISRLKHDVEEFKNATN